MLKIIMSRNYAYHVRLLLHVLVQISTIIFRNFPRFKSTSCEQKISLFVNEVHSLLMKNSPTAPNRINCTLQAGNTNTK